MYPLRNLLGLGVVILFKVLYLTKSVSCATSKELVPALGDSSVEDSSAPPRLRGRTSTGTTSRVLQRPRETIDGVIYDSLMFRITVMEEIQAGQDGSNYVAQTVAIPILDLKEDFFLYDIDLPADVASEHSQKIKKGRLFVSITNVQLTDDYRVVLFNRRSKLTVLTGNPLPPPPVPDNGVPSYEEGNLVKYTRKVAIVRVSVSNGSPVVYSANELREGMFGNANGISLKSQYLACTNQRLTFELDDVYEITTPGRVSDYASPADLRNAALALFVDQYNKNHPGTIGSPGDAFDHVIVVLPPNSWSNFIGNAATGAWISTLNNDWSLDVMVYMHEIG